MEKHDVVIIGGGPAGLACAARLNGLGVRNVVVLEREAEAGGVPRHCGHWGFGWESHRRLMTGPAYAARLRADAQRVDVRTRHAALGFLSPTRLQVHTPSAGVTEMEARYVVMATGARESTRAALLLGGTRPAGVLNTATLQQLVYLKAMKPFARPVILGGEWVSFSALMTCHHADIRPTAMIMEHLEAPWFFPVGAWLRYGVPIHRRSRLLAIHGTSAVEAVEVETDGQRRLIACDGVIVSGNFVPEDTLFKTGPFAAAPTVFSQIGNVHGALKTAGGCAREGWGMAERIAQEHRR